MVIHVTYRYNNQMGEVLNRWKDEKTRLAGLLTHTQNILLVARDLNLADPNSIAEVGTTNQKGDKILAIDLFLERAIVKYCVSEKLPVVIESEESGRVALSENPEFLLYIDPLDGSHNKKDGNGLLPYGTLVAFYKGTEPVLNNIITAGAIEFTRDLGFLYGGGKTTHLNGNRIKLKQNWLISDKTPIFLETYKKGYERWEKLADYMFIRNQGALVDSLTMVLSGAAPVMGGIAIKGEELGPIYALIKGAGGISLDLTGKDIGGLKLEPGINYEILSGNPDAVKFALEKLQPGLK